MKPVEIEITVASSEELAVSIDYHTGVTPVIKRWHAERSVVDGICRDVDELMEDTLSHTATDEEAAEQRQNINERMRSLGLALFQEILKEECDHVRELVPEPDLYLLFKIDRSLAHVPFEMMFDGHRFLSHRFAMGRAIYAEDAKVFRTIENVAPYKAVLLGDPSEDPTIRQDVEDEIDTVKRVLGRSGKFSLRIATGRDIDQKLILSLLPSATVLHFSGHGAVSEDEGHTGIKLQDKKVLSGSSLRGLQMPPAVAFFNMCSAASKEAWKSSLGLIETLLRRGTKACVASLWNLRSKSATLLASRLYAYLIQDETFGHALRKARLDVVERCGTHDPTWAAYTLYGDPQLTLLATPAARPEATRTGRRLAAVCAVLILVAFILFPVETHRDDLAIPSRVAVGYLLLESTPQDATILIDGTEIGMTPFTAEVSVGSHRVTIEKRGYKQWEAWVEVRETPRAVIQAYLEEVE